MKRQNVLCCPQNFALVWSMLLSGIQGQRSHIRFTRTSVQQTRVRFVRLAGFSTIYHITHLWKIMENIIFVSPFFVTGTEDCDLTVSDSHHQRYFMTFQKNQTSIRHQMKNAWKLLFEDGTSLVQQRQCSQSRHLQPFCEHVRRLGWAAQLAAPDSTAEIPNHERDFS